MRGKSNSWYCFSVNRLKVKLGQGSWWSPGTKGAITGEQFAHLVVILLLRRDTYTVTRCYIDCHYSLLCLLVIRSSTEQVRVMLFVHFNTASTSSHSVPQRSNVKVRGSQWMNAILELQGGANIVSAIETSHHHITLIGRLYARGLTWRHKMTPLSYNNTGSRGGVGTVKSRDAEPQIASLVRSTVDVAQRVMLHGCCMLAMDDCMNVLTQRSQCHLHHIIHIM